MRSLLIVPCLAGLISTIAPDWACADTAPQAPAVPGFSSLTATLSSVHAWDVTGATKRELTPASAQIAKTDLTGMNSGAMTASMIGSMATSALAVAAGPIGMVVGPIVSLFGHHSAPSPSFHTVMALSGPHSASEFKTGSPSFEVAYADATGVDPNAFAPVIVKLAPTKDNWRVVLIASSSDPSFAASLMMPAGMPNVSGSGSSSAAPQLSEEHVPGAAVQLVAPGHARITFAQPLAPGEYGIVLRPVGAAEADSLKRVISTVWDFSVTGQ